MGFQIEIRVFFFLSPRWGRLDFCLGFLCALCHPCAAQLICTHIIGLRHQEHVRFAEHVQDIWATHVHSRCGASWMGQWNRQHCGSTPAACQQWCLAGKRDITFSKMMRWFNLPIYLLLSENNKKKKRSTGKLYPWGLIFLCAQECT